MKKYKVFKEIEFCIYMFFFVILILFFDYDNKELFLLWDY